jgi:hypothetical protein
VFFLCKLHKKSSRIKYIIIIIIINIRFPMIILFYFGFNLVLLVHPKCHFVFNNFNALNYIFYKLDRQTIQDFKILITP